MKESDIQLKVSHMMRDKYGYMWLTQQDAYKCQKCGKVWRPPRNRPDVVYVHPRSFGVFIEFKALKLTSSLSLPFSTLTEGQEKWLNWWHEDWGGLGYVGIGIIDTPGKRDECIDIFVVDWQGWLDTKEMITPYQLSIPYAFGKGMRKDLVQDGVHYDMITLWNQYRLRGSGDNWTLPVGHSATPHRRDDGHYHS